MSLALVIVLISLALFLIGLFYLNSNGPIQIRPTRANQFHITMTLVPVLAWSQFVQVIEYDQSVFMKYSNSSTIVIIITIVAYLIERKKLKD